MKIIAICFELRVSYDWRAMSSKLSKTQLILVSTLLWLLAELCGRGMCSQTTPSWHVTQGVTVKPHEVANMMPSETRGGCVHYAFTC